jgi:hypothetical protein
MEQLLYRTLEKGCDPNASVSNCASRRRPARNKIKQRYEHMIYQTNPILGVTMPACSTKLNCPPFNLVTVCIQPISRLRGSCLGGSPAEVLEGFQTRKRSVRSRGECLLEAFPLPIKKTSPQITTLTTHNNANPPNASILNRFEISFLLLAPAPVSPILPIRIRALDPRLQKLKLALPPSKQDTHIHLSELFAPRSRLSDALRRPACEWPSPQPRAPAGNEAETRSGRPGVPPSRFDWPCRQNAHLKPSQVSPCR